jgi:hypothetical protein
MVDAAKKIAKEATCPMMMESGMGAMMGSGMGGMMMGSGMGMGTMMNPAAIGSGVATGVAVATSSATGRSLVGRLLSHPLVLFGAGLAIGCLIHKYREEIIEAAGRAAAKGRGIVS